MDFLRYRRAANTLLSLQNQTNGYSYQAMAISSRPWPTKTLPTRPPDNHTTGSGVCSNPKELAAPHDSFTLPRAISTSPPSHCTDLAQPASSFLHRTEGPALAKGFKAWLKTGLEGSLRKGRRDVQQFCQGKDESYKKEHRLCSGTVWSLLLGSLGTCSMV